MNTAVRERPAGTGTGAGGVAARRAIIRWAWRVFRRDWRQQLLALGLLTVAVAATVAGASIAANAASKASTNGTFGTAGYLVSIPGRDPGLQAGIAAIKAQAGTIDVIENQKIAAASVQSVTLRAQDPHGAYGYPMLSLLTGRYPAGPEQVAVTSQVATLFNLHLGSTWRQDGRALRVVGTVENPQNLQDSFALVAPGQIRSPSQVIVLSDDPSLGAVKLPAGSVIAVRPSPPGGPVELVVAFATFGMLFIGLVAVAGFTVTAQRRLRSLGMLAALGAADRHIRLAVIANGVVVGVAAAVAGTAAGLLAWTFSIPSVQATAAHQVTWTDVAWQLIAVAAVLAVVTAAAAAWWPARTVSRIPVVAALSGRPGPQRPTRRSIVPGAALLAAGAAVLTAAGAGSGSPPLLIAGITGTTLGTLLLAPLAITALAALCGRARLPVRLAVRDLARYRTRSGAALAAIFVAIEIAAIVAIGFTARYGNPVSLTGPNLAPNELIVFDNPADNDGGVPDTTTTPQDITAAVQELGTSIHAKAVIGLDLAILPTAASFGDVKQTAGLYQVAEGRGYESAGQLYVATPALLAHYGISQAAINPAAEILTSRTGLGTVSRLQLDPYGEGCPAGPVCNYPPPKIQTLSQLPGETDEPNLLITPHAMQALNLQAVPAGWLIQTPTALTPAQITTARQTAISIGGIIDTKNSTPSLSELSGGATAAGILLALGVLAMTVGLVRSETAADLRTLTATGASATTRRSLTGITAAALATLGAILGTATAYAVGIAWYRKSLATTIAHVPVTNLAVILAGLPMIAFIGGWLLAGREPSPVSRQALE